jgi:triphosphoribosyl-dephospho-CoA synthase
MERSSTQFVPEGLVAQSAATALTLVYSAPTPGTGSRYLDGRVAHESRVLSVAPASDALAALDRKGVGETVLEATRSSLALAGFADPRGAGYLAPLARAALSGEPSARVLADLGHAEILPFARALAREYARDFEVTRELARPALLTALSRADSVRGALVQAYLEVLSEVPDLDVAGRAGRHEAEEVSRMAHGVLKAGGIHSRRGLEGTANLGGLLRAEPRLSPTTTEYPVITAAFLVALEYGPDALSYKLRPARGVDRGR